MLEVTKFLRCDDCKGSGMHQDGTGTEVSCDSCDGKGKTYVGKATDAEINEYGDKELLELYSVEEIEEGRKKLKNIFRQAKNPKPQS
jgi:RecJ-like exonuclease